MDFFQQQARVRSHSHWLVFLFLLAVAGIVGAVDLVVELALRWGSDQQTGVYALPPVQDGPVLIATSAVVLGLIGLASLYRITSLHAGGAVVARELGATLVSPDTADPKHRKLRNVIEEIAIASGVPVPQIFVLEKETGINAFAAGYTPADAAVTVTRGALDKLSRDELQGVIGHEFSHILNGDMRLNIRLMGLIFGILALAVIAQKVLLYGGRGDSRRGAPILLAALGVLIIGYVGVFFGRLIKASLSRQREYLADASAVQFTRQTQGIAGALKKLAGVSAGSKLQQVHAEEVAHMLFGDGVGYTALFATHPPLLRRIQALEPQFDPRQLPALGQTWNDPGYEPQDEEHAVMADLAGAPAAGLTAQVGRPQSAHYDCAAELHQALPAELLAAARGQDQALALTFGLLLDDSAEIRAHQLAQVQQEFGAPCRAQVEALAPALAALAPAQRLPLAAIAIPSLRRRPRQELIQLMRAVTSLIETDGRVEVFGYCLGRLLRMQVGEALQPARAAPPGRRKLDQCRGELACLLSLLAEFGQDDERSARAAFAAGTARLPVRPALDYGLPEHSWTKAMDAALAKLDELELPAKALLLEAMEATVQADGKLTIEEAELLRAVSASLHCPLPPTLAEAA